MLWQRLFASFDADHGNRDLIVGTAYAAVMYFALYLIPQAVTAYLIPLVFLPLFGLAIVLKSREIDRDQPMFEDVPRDHPHVYRTVVRDYWRSAFCVGALGFCTGIMRSLAIGEPQVGALVNVLSMAGSLVAAVTVLVLWQFKNLRMNVVGAYRVVFPFVITSFLLLPFLMVAYAQWLAAILYAVYSVAIVLMMIQCAQASRDRGINPVFVYGFFGGVVYALHDVGFIGGSFAEQISVTGIEPVAVVGRWWPCTCWGSCTSWDRAGSAGYSHAAATRRASSWWRCDPPARRRGPLPRPRPLRRQPPSRRRSVRPWQASPSTRTASRSRPSCCASTTT